MRPRYLIALTASLVVLSAGCSSGPAAGAAPTNPQVSPAAQPTQPTGGRVTKRYPNAPAMSIDANKQYSATLHTSDGDIQIELLAQDAPVTVNNFVFLANDNFYDGVRFHRIIKGFMVQTGDPQGNGTGGPGYRFQDEPVKRDYKPGTVAMANAGPNTNGSQFFIMHGDYSGRLPKNYTIFGQVTAGMEVLEKIASAPVSPGPTGELSSPGKEVTIASVGIAEQ